jgi:TonB family protein
MRLVVTFLACFLAAPLFANDGNTVLLADLADHAMQQSQITLPGGKPFHLKATIAEKDSPDSDYKAKVEEYWVSPTKWRRTISSPDFSQTLVTNGESVFEEDTGDYYPVWLNHFITAIFDPLPILEQLRQAGVRASKRDLAAGETSCADLPMRVDRWVLCFTGKKALLSSIFTKGYAAEFKDFKAFGDKQVSRLIENTPEPGTIIDARIDELTELKQPNETLFVVEHGTQPKDRIKSVYVAQDTFMKLAITGTEVAWPPQGGGPTTGGCAVYVGADRAGNVRESWPEGCDSTGIQTALRDIVKTWKLRPPVSNGAPVQVEALLGFTFHTVVHDNPLPLLTDAEIRQLATNTVEPNFLKGPQAVPAGTEVTVQISVDETGKLTGITNTREVPDALFQAAYAAITQWHFRPYMKDQKPQYIHANVTFHVPKPIQ